jgi:hypothetical protein
MKVLRNLLVVLGLLALAGPVRAQAPVGAWSGAFADGSGSLSLVVTGSGASYKVNPGYGTVWSWSFQQTSRVGGILTIYYWQVGFRNRLYYSITWVNRNTIILSDPGFKVVLRRRS